jgi:hypothetical protein
MRFTEKKRDTKEREKNQKKIDRKDNQQRRRVFLGIILVDLVVSSLMSPKTTMTSLDLRQTTKRDIHAKSKETESKE